MEKVLSLVYKASDLRFPFIEIPLLRDYIRDFHSLDASDLWMLSLTLEPREANQATVVPK